jgi:hypothetical protein
MTKLTVKEFAAVVTGSVSLQQCRYAGMKYWQRGTIARHSPVAIGWRLLTGALLMLTLISQFNSRIKAVNDQIQPVASGVRHISTRILH